MDDPRRLDIAELNRRAQQFERALEDARRRIEGRGRQIAWYPYRSLSGLAVLDKLLRGERRRLLALAGEEPVLDLGCADGELAFFLESLGLRVHAVDYPETNCNGMEGVRALKEELGSSIEILGVDLDSQFTLPGQRYGLAFFLGTLYHLKNPYYAMEALAARARYCVLSTRIAAFAADRKTEIRRLPVAYLLREGEANQDWTNYWVFSEAGLRVLLERTGWEILDFATFGSGHSDPVSAEGDQRAFCLLKSLPRARAGEIELLRGWHQIEYGCWRWTEREFAARAPLPAGMRPRVVLRFFVPEVVIQRLGPVTLSASANGVPLAPETYHQPGEYTFARGLARGQAGRRVHIEFRLDRALPPDEGDPRERGIIVSSLTIE
ncbi:MAG: class I SAM-dependent methyltransferase [Bryobacteraceae bacterium]